MANISYLTIKRPISYEATVFLTSANDVMYYENGSYSAWDNNAHSSVRQRSRASSSGVRLFYETAGRSWKMPVHTGRKTRVFRAGDSWRASSENYRRRNEWKKIECVRWAARQKEMRDAVEQRKKKRKTERHSAVSRVFAYKQHRAYWWWHSIRIRKFDSWWTWQT